MNLTHTHTLVLPALFWPIVALIVLVFTLFQLAKVITFLFEWKLKELEETLDVAAIIRSVSDLGRNPDDSVRSPRNHSVDSESIGKTGSQN